MTVHLQRYVGTTTDVLVEQARNGRTPHYVHMRLNADATPGEIRRVRITAADAESLSGEVIQ